MRESTFYYLFNNVEGKRERLFAEGAPANKNLFARSTPANTYIFVDILCRNIGISVNITNEDKFEYYPHLKNEDNLKNWPSPQNIRQHKKLR